MTQRIAVYGTLKKDFGNHRVLGEKAEFVGEGVTEENYTMLGLEWIPMVYKNPSTAPIHVEVYDVPDEQLLKGPIDRLEGNGYVYNREKIKIALEGEEKTEAWMYFSVSDSIRSEAPKPNFEGAYKWGYSPKS